MKYIKFSPNGTKRYYKDGLLNREDGPAIIYNDGDKFWYINDVCHRLDGPALEFYDGSKAWYYKGKMIDCESTKEFHKKIKLLIFL